MAKRVCGTSELGLGVLWLLVLLELEPPQALINVKDRKTRGNRRAFIKLTVSSGYEVAMPFGDQILFLCSYM
ncbi:MAG: hypothetical protein ACJA1T_001429 [Zhongshania aliphaticivorans]|jgi:hypothetical protein